MSEEFKHTDESIVAQQTTVLAIYGDRDDQINIDYQTIERKGNSFKKIDHQKIIIPFEYLDRLINKLQEVKAELKDYSEVEKIIPTTETSHTKHSMTIPNKLINDPYLKLKDLGLLLYLLSKHGGAWSVESLMQERGIGRDAVYGMLKRLRDAGYAKYTKNSDGTTEWTFTDNR